ncbi:FG-GAP repeat domain-containing protein [Actibacterium sp. D379-3]
MLRAAVIGAVAALSATGALAQDATRIKGPRADCVGAITAARYDRPTTRYDHGILGDAVEWGGLSASVTGKPPCGWRQGGVDVILPDSLVFEDIAPRLADLDGDGAPEIVTVETALTKGARLTVWGLDAGQFKRLAATPFIGQPHRWLAPLGAADLDGDGFVEIAYIDRPHLTKRLRVWRYRDGGLVPVAGHDGLTNHRIGQDVISGGIRVCGQGPEMVTANADWSRLMAVRLSGGQLVARDIGAHNGPDSFAAALACAD